MTLRRLTLTRCVWVTTYTLFSTTAVGAQARWIVDVRPLLTIGDSEAAGGGTPFGVVSGATRRPDSSLVVSDGTAPALRFFDAQGRSTKTVGRSGSGPGEFRVISWLGRCGGDSLVTYDLFQRRFSIFDSAGRFVRQFAASGDAGAAACAPDGRIAVVGGAGTTQGADRRVRARVSLLAPSGEALLTIPDVPFYEMASAGGVPLPDPLGPVTTVALTRDRLFVGTGADLAIDVYDRAGAKQARYLLPGTARRPTDAHRAAGVSEFVRFTTDATMRRAMESQLARVPSRTDLPPYSAIFTDVQGLLWVHRSVPGDSTSRFIVLAPEGRAIAEVELPVFTRVFEIGQDYILGGRESVDGEPQVVMWRLTRSK